MSNNENGTGKGGRSHSGPTADLYARPGEAGGDSMRPDDEQDVRAPRPDGACGDGQPGGPRRMNCDRCPHMKHIREALAPCQLCEAGKLHGQVSADAAPNADLVYAYRRATDHAPTTGVTTLTPDVEDAVRKLTATLFQLDPIELLLVRHVMLGGRYFTFAETLAKISRRLRVKERELNGEKHGFRSLVNTWANAIRAKLPVFASVLYRGDEER